MTRFIFRMNSKRMMMIGLSFIICHLSFSPAGAQTYTQRLQQKPASGQGTVTIHQSDSIDQLVNGAVLVARPARPANGTTPSGTQQNQQEIAGQSGQNITNPSATDTTQVNHTVRATYKSNGYRVQAFAGGNSREDRLRAERIRNNIKQLHPHTSVYVHFRSPRWICHVGNYKTYEDAHRMLTTLQNEGFNQATIVRSKITVAY